MAKPFRVAGGAPDAQKHLAQPTEPNVTKVQAHARDSDSDDALRAAKEMGAPDHPIAHAKVGDSDEGTFPIEVPWPPAEATRNEGGPSPAASKPFKLK